MNARCFAVLVLAGVAAGGLAGCKGEKPASGGSGSATATPAASATTAAASTTPAAEPTAPAAAALDVAGPDAYDAPALSRVELPSGLIIEDLRIGHGAAALPRAFMSFHYRGKIQGGKEFNVTSEAPGGPKPEEQAINRLIPGLATGLVGMKEGGRRRLTIPPQLAPGIVGLKDAEGNDRIPGDATLIYVIDAMTIKQQLVPATPAPTQPAAPTGASAPDKPAAAPGQP